MKNKTKRNFILILLTVAVFLLGAGVLSACKIGLDEFKEYEKKYNLSGSVVYYANGGYFDGKNNITRKELYYSKDAPMLNVTEANEKLPITRANYTLSGWKIASEEKQVEADGKKVWQPVTDASDPWVQFPRQIGEQEHLIVYAVWTPKAKLDCYLISKGENFSFTSDGVSYTTGSDTPFTTLEKFSVFTRENEFFKKGTVGATFVGLYADEACTELYAGSVATITRPTDGTNAKLYVRYVQGDWNIITDSTGINSLLSAIESNGAEGQKYLLRNDCDNVSVAPRTGTTFKGILDGDGHVLTDFKLQGSALKVASDYSLFGKIGKEAVIRNLTIDKMTVSYNINGSQATETLSAIATGIESGATFENFVIKDMTMKVEAKYGTQFKNFDTVDVDGKMSLKDKDMWVFGGTDGTDTVVLKAFEEGIKVEYTQTDMTRSQAISFEQLDV